MKKNYILIAIALILGFVACNTEEEPVIPSDKNKTYTVSLNLTGEIDVTQEPLSRFTPSETALYGIQVDYKPISGGGYAHYAYGLFDDISDTSIELIENHLYRFTVLMIEDGKNAIYRDSILVDSQNYLGYGKPFKAYNAYNASTSVSITKITNKFTIAEDKYFEYGSFGNYIKYTLPSGKEFDEPEGIETYFGRVEDYLPSEDGTAISIYLKRMVYGLKFQATDFLTEGTLRIDFGNYYYTLTPEKKEVEVTLSYNEPLDWYNKVELADADDYHTMYTTWTKADGTKVEYTNKTIYYSRLRQTIVTIDYYSDDVMGKNSLSMKYESDEEAEITAGNSYIHGDEQGDYKW